MVRRVVGLLALVACLVLAGCGTTGGQAAKKVSHTAPAKDTSDMASSFLANTLWEKRQMPVPPGTQIVFYAVPNRPAR